MSGKPMKTTTDAASPAWKMSTTLAAAFFCLSAVALLIYAGIEVFFNIRMQEAVISNRQQVTAQDAAKTVSNFIEQTFNLLESAVWLTRLDAGSEAEQRETLQGLLGAQPGIRRVVLLGEDHRILAQASRGSMWKTRWSPTELEGILPRPEMRQGREISRVSIDSVTNEPMVALAVPLTNVLGEVKGTLIAELNLKSMWDVVDRLKVGKSGYVYVSDRKGNLLAFHDTARVLRGENVSHLKPVADFMKSNGASQPETVSRYPGLRGVTVVGTYVPLKTPDWAVITELPWDEAYRGVFQELSRAVAFTMALSIIAGVLGVLIARRLAHPVINLTETASRIAAGERDLQAAVSGSREIASLAFAFNSMTAQLRQTLKDLEQRFADLRQTEESLRLSEERLRLSLEGTFDGIWDWNFGTGRVYFSPRYYTMLGYEPDEFPPGYESWRSLVHPDDLEQAEETVHRAVEEISSFAIEVRLKTKSGDWRWILGRGKVVEWDDEGKAVRLAGSHTDISERKRAEENLRKYERIVSTSRDLMALVSRDYIYEAVNESFLRAHRKSREEVIGRSVPQILGESAFRQRIQPQFDRTLSGETVNFQAPFEFAGLGRRVMDVMYFPMSDETGKVVGVVVNSRDITETRKLEEQLMQAQKIESIGTLASGVAHEINNPINGIMNYAQLILDRQGDDNPSREYAGEIIHETERIAGIVRNLLTFARHEKQSHSPALLQDIVSSVLSLIQTVMRHDQIDLEVSIPDDLPSIRCRSQQIQQVLMNLMTNARDALNERYPGHSPDKKLRVFAGLLRKEGRRFIRATVEDRGGGIPAEVRDRIFDPFFTTKPKETGTGLGLSISYGIVRDHGGELSFESEPGLATRFHVDLPLDNGESLCEDPTEAANG
jgi:PAS domain S-box-containing protein